MRKAKNNSRRGFLKKIPIAIVSISAFSIFNFKKTKTYFEKKYNTLSKAEADEIIKNDDFPVSIQSAPAPAPVGQKSVK